MNTEFDFNKKPDVAWCPGCGNFSILTSLKNALVKSKFEREKVVIVSGIGQAAKTPQYVNASFFNGLHGRSLPAATAIKATNPELIVIAESGDGCTYGEGGNHFLATIRRNPDITNIVHDNMVYGLTKGQASPTSSKGFKTPVQVSGVIMEPFNPVAVAITMNASFVARAFSGDIEQTTEIIMKAMAHKGYALVDIFQPCVSFNKINNYQWYRDHTYYLNDEYDPTDKDQALAKAFETDKYPLGIIYKENNNPTFEENIQVYKENKAPLFMTSLEKEKLERIIESKRA